MLSSSKKAIGPANDLRIEINSKTGEIKAVAKLKVVDWVRNESDEIALPKAQKLKPDAQLGESNTLPCQRLPLGAGLALAELGIGLELLGLGERDLVGFVANPINDLELRHRLDFSGLRVDLDPQVVCGSDGLL